MSDYEFGTRTRYEDTDLHAMRDDEPDVEPSPRPGWLGRASDGVFVLIFVLAIFGALTATVYSVELVQMAKGVTR
jgi:hypothetical protein